MLLSTTLRATADADIQLAEAIPLLADANFGADEQLRVRLDATDTLASFVKFDLTDVESVGQATLKLRGGQTGTVESQVSVGAFPVTDLAWVEGNGRHVTDLLDLDLDNDPDGELRWNNQPGTSGGALDSVEITGEGEYLWDVSGYVRQAKARGDTTIGFALKHTGGGNTEVAFESREGSNGPELIIEEDTTGPVAALVAADITTAGPTQTYVVTYTDTDNIDIDTIDDGDLEVSNPQGDKLELSTFSVDSANPKSVAVTYVFDAPGGAWDLSDNGLYTAVLKEGGVRDVAGNNATGGPDSFTVAITQSEPPPEQDVTGPVATVSAAPTLTIEQETRTVTVTYVDGVAVDVDTIGEDDIDIGRSGGSSPEVTDVSVIRSEGDKTVTATYTLTGPGGSWESGDNGTYTVTVREGKVKDTNGNDVGGASSTFDVNIAAPRPDVDPDFGSGGAVSSPFVAEGAAGQSDGKVVVVGRQGDLSAGTSRAVIQRFNADGSPDNSFGEGGKVTGPEGLNEAFFAVTVTQDGGIVAAGRRGNDLLVVRFKAKGKTENKFGDKGRATADLGADDDTAFAVALAPDGSVIAGGGAGGAFAFARFTDKGELDGSFGDNGRVIVPRGGGNVVGAVAVDSQGRVVGAGPLANKVAVIRLNPNGSLDSGFGDNGVLTIQQLNTRTDLGRPDRSIGINVQGEKIVVNNRTPGGDFAVARVNANGSLDSSFGGDGVTTVDFGGDDDADAVILQSTGEVFALGTTDAGGPKVAVAALDSSGNLIQEFGSGGKLTIDAGVTSSSRELHVGDLVLRAFGTSAVGGRLVLGSSNQSQQASTNTTLRRINAPGFSSVGNFGIVSGSSRPRKLVFTDADGTAVTISLKSGSGEAFYDGNVLDLVLTGTGAKSSLTISAKGGNGRVTVRDLRSSGALKSLSAKAVDVVGTIFVDGSLGKAALASLTGTLGVNGNITSVAFARDVSGGRVFAGADFGSDFKRGGSGSADDTWSSGRIGKISVAGSLHSAVFAAGLDLGNNTLLDSDDQVLGGDDSAIGSISVKGSTDLATRFVANRFPKTAKLPQKVKPVEDSRFVIT